MQSVKIGRLHLKEAKDKKERARNQRLQEEEIERERTDWILDPPKKVHEEDGAKSDQGWFFDLPSDRMTPTTSEERMRGLPFDPIIHFHNNSINNEILSFLRYSSSSQQKQDYRKQLEELALLQHQAERERNSRSKYGRQSLALMVCIFKS